MECDEPCKENKMKYLSVCSGIESATAAWDQLGWTPVAFSEVDPFASAVLAERFPLTPNLGDINGYESWGIAPNSIDLLVAGTPCQSFSVAGLRQGLKDPRGNLMLTFLAIAKCLRPKWIVWENVFGVLSSNGGKDFGSFVGALGELGYGWAYRVLDAQWVRTQRHPRAVPQRRRRVFVVGCLGDERRAAQVLFESESVCRNPSSRRAKGQGVAADAVEGSATGHPVGQWWDGRDTAATLSCTSAGCDARMPDKGNFGAVLQPVDIVRSSSFGGYKSDHGAGGTVRRSLGGNSGGETLVVGTDCYNLALTGDVAVPYDLFQITAPVNRQSRQPGDPCHTLARDNAAHAAVLACPTGRNAPLAACDSPMVVRRLTPTECERLMGFPDGWTLIPYRGKPADECPDGPRYKALGNSMAVNCSEWIGERIAAVESCSKVPERIQNV